MKDSHNFFVLVFIFMASCSTWRSNAVEELELAPISAQAHFFQGVIDESEGRLYRAIEHFDKASNLDPEIARIHLHLGRCWIYLNRYQKGVASLQKTEQYAQRDDYVLWYDLGEVYGRMGMVVAAKRCYEKSLNIYPKFQKAQQALTELATIAPT